eukprot:CAMPEP_0168340466 /NCGR_PEP_ID=MMETSP0213-20121227/14079_1 /TAXON_ID=151035 /ORGANISM="Euplotes harpa, Strain FSP1.4" /LENGTH=120 /DNA_ID=CAMNT_0008346705 /DNA_START=703 /DNA_END=1065 /DNA_ORIENTATION=-
MFCLGGFPSVSIMFLMYRSNCATTCLSMCLFNRLFIIDLRVFQQDIVVHPAFCDHLAEVVDFWRERSHDVLLLALDLTLFGDLLVPFLSPDFAAFIESRLAAGDDHVVGLQVRPEGAFLH